MSSSAPDSHPCRVGLALRSCPAPLAMRALQGDPEFGPVMNILFRDDQFIPNQGMYRSDWRVDWARAGSGALLEHSIHDVDLLEWAFGPIRQVSAVTANLHGHDGIEDSVSALMVFEGGFSATLTSVWHDVLARPSVRRVEVFCRDGLVVLEGDLAGPVWWQRDDDDGRIEDARLDAWLGARRIDVEPSENVFLRDVRLGTTTGPTFEDALSAHQIVDALYRSASAGDVPVEVMQ